MARTASQSTRGLASETRNVRQLQQSSNGPCERRRPRGLRTFALTADVSEARRQVPIDPQDWHLLGCRVEIGGTVFVNTVGTFGIASASYYWSRVAFSQEVAGDRAESWHMIVADDYHLETSGQDHRTALCRNDAQIGSLGGPGHGGNFTVRAYVKV